MGMSEVKAQTYSGKILEKEWIPGIFIKKDKPNGGQKFQQARFIRRSEDNQFVYCLQPYVSIDNNYTYNVQMSDYLEVLNMSEEQWTRASLLAYYGYGYGSHTSDKWYAVTQVLIWRTVSPGNAIYFTNTLDGTRNDNLYVDEIEELNRLVDSHLTRPNFNNNSLVLPIGQTASLNDVNGVLSKYKVTSTNNVEASIRGNTLNIKATGIGNGTVNLQKVDTKYDMPPVVYYSPYSQDVMRVGQFDPVPASFQLKVIGGKVELHKLDSDKKVAIASGEATLTGARYGVFTTSGEKVATLVTDNNAYAISDYLPSLGTYYLQEEVPSEGYTLDRNIYYFELTEDNLLASVNVYEKVIEREVELTKVFASDETKIMTPEVGIQFGFYNNKGEEVARKTTDSNGKLNVKLAYGTYTVKQLNTTVGHEKVKDFTISVKSSGDKFYYTISNAEVSARLKIVKVDKETKDIITKAGTTFKIKDLSTGEYVKQKVTYPSVVVYEEFQTDENGWLITPYPLDSGRYKIEEVKAPNGYTVNLEGVEFTIDETTKLLNNDDLGNYIEIRFENQEVYGTIEIKKEGDMLFSIDEDRNFIFDKKAMNGVEFEVYANEDIYSANGVLIYKKGAFVEKITTKNGGIAKTKKLHLGKYCVKEVKTLSGYKLDGTTYCYDLKYKDQYTEIIEAKDTLYNEYKSVELELLKVGEYFSKIEDGKSIFELKPLKGVTFGLYASENIFAENGKLLVQKDELIKSFKTDADGKIIISTKMPFNSYYFKEILTHENYVLNDEEYHFTIDKNSEEKEVIKLKINNGQAIRNDMKTGNLKITKVDKNGEKLSGVEFTIYDEDKETIIYQGVTNEEGIIDLELPYGKYYYQETKALENYEIDDNLYEFEIDDENKDITVEMENHLKTGTIIITKVDSNGNKLSGVEFTIYAEDMETIIYQGVTNEEGIIELELIYGKYYYQETKALDGYQLDDKLYEFEINDETRDIKVDMENMLIPVPDTEANSYIVYIPVGLALLGTSIYLISRKRKK